MQNISARTPLQVVKDYCTIFTKKDVTFKCVRKSVKKNILKSEIKNFAKLFQSFSPDTQTSFINLIKEWTGNTLEFDEIDDVSLYAALIFSTIVLFNDTMGNVELKLKIKTLSKHKYEISLTPYNNLVTLPSATELVNVSKTKDGYFLKSSKVQKFSI